MDGAIPRGAWRTRIRAPRVIGRSGRGYLATRISGRKPRHRLVRWRPAEVLHPRGRIDGGDLRHAAIRPHVPSMSADPVGPDQPTHAERLALRQAIRRYVPIVRWLPAYDRGDLRLDGIAGIVSWGVMVPVAMAYAGLAGMPPETGLVTAFAALTAYAVFGTSRHLKVTASSSVAIMSASVVGALAAGDPSDYVALSAALALIVGAILDRGGRGQARVPVAVPGGIGGDRVRHRSGRGHHHRPDPGPARDPVGRRHDPREGLSRSSGASMTSTDTRRPSASARSSASSS